MKNIRPLITYKELFAARSVAVARKKEVKKDIIKFKLILIFTGYLNTRAYKNLEVLRYELDKLDQHLIAIDSTYYEQIQFIEYNLDTNFPNL